MDDKYAEHALNHRMLLRDIFFTHYLQSEYLSQDDILDVQTLVFDCPKTPNNGLSSARV